MRCPICKFGEMISGKTFFTSHQGDSVVVVKHVPAQECANCGETFLSESIAKRLYEENQKAAPEGVGVEVREYREAA